MSKLEALLKGTNDDLAEAQQTIIKAGKARRAKSKQDSDEVLHHSIFL